MMIIKFIFNALSLGFRFTTRRFYQFMSLMIGLFIAHISLTKLGILEQFKADGFFKMYGDIALVLMGLGIFLIFLNAKMRIVDRLKLSIWFVCLGFLNSFLFSGNILFILVLTIIANHWLKEDYPVVTIKRAFLRLLDAIFSLWPLVYAVTLICASLAGLQSQWGLGVAIVVLLLILWGARIYFRYQAQV